MNKSERILLLQLILEDIRGNWSELQEERIKYALDLCNSLYDVDGIKTLSVQIQHYDLLDGRYFRNDYPYGYIGMGKLHGLSKTFNDKSNEFKSEARAILTYPEYRLTDM